MSGSPPGSILASAASPQIIAPAPASAVAARPSLCMKPMQATTSPAANAGSPTGSLTSKEWIVPPRPKPGRKPATDTPPTKRKAQNRAAQRAFRERRAARVGELEEQMKLVEDEFEQEKDELRLDVARLEKEVEQYRAQVTEWATKCRTLESELAKFKAHQSAKESADSTVHPKQHQHEADAGEGTVGCGNCTIDTPCQCIDDAFNAMNGHDGDIEQLQHGKRAPPLTIASKGKRIKLESPEDMEVDFTAMFSQPHRPSTGPEAVSPSTVVADPCGFCQDGTPCICAEMAAEQETQAATSVGSGRQMAQFTPPPSEGDVTHAAVRLPAACVSGPGTCAQCRADPNSTLFCKSLAASRAQSGSAAAGCCGGQGRAGGCCQDSVPLPSRKTRSRMATNKNTLPPIQANKSSVTLTCADAYTTLSRHPAYDRASGDIANWLPKLNANPTSAEGRPAMEIDAANVMAVLRDFDRRFGTDR